MTSRPPPRTNNTRSRPSVSTSRNSMSAEHHVKEAATEPRGNQGHPHLGKGTCTSSTTPLPVFPQRDTILITFAVLRRTRHVQ
jgi:hypothetical protein